MEALSQGNKQQDVSQHSCASDRSFVTAATAAAAEADGMAVPASDDTAEVTAAGMKVPMPRFGLFARARMAARRGLSVAMSGSAASRERAAQVMQQRRQEEAEEAEREAEAAQEVQEAAAQTADNAHTADDANAAPTAAAAAAAAAASKPSMGLLRRASSAVRQGFLLAVTGSDSSRARMGLVRPDDADEDDESPEASKDKLERTVYGARPRTSTGGARGSNPTPSSSEASSSPSSRVIAHMITTTEDDSMSIRTGSSALSSPRAASGRLRARSAAPYSSKGRRTSGSSSEAAEPLGMSPSDRLEAAAASKARSAVAAAVTPRGTRARRFPNGFMWGAATSAHQVEGAYLDDGKGLSIWDAFTHADGRVADGTHADVSTCHYYRYREDVALMRSMSIKTYRFSISWARLFPNGRGKLNERGVTFYNRLINELVANKITPIVTLYHWDLPLSLQVRF